MLTYTFHNKITEEISYSNTEVKEINLNILSL
jgi:hypothetical protein